MVSAPRSRRSRSLSTAFAIILAVVAATTAHVKGQSPFVPGANVNMVRGTAFVDGDPYLQRQNEPSIAISTRNPCHLLAGANDYRTVDFPDPTPLPNEEGVTQAPIAPTPRDAWLGVFTSMDCGTTWKSRLLPGHPFDTSPEGQAPQNVNRGYTAGADPVVRAATNGLFFYAGLVFDRADTSRSQIFVARFIDNNNKERGETIEYVDAAAVDTGDPDTFVDKPWLGVDQPRAGAALCDIKGQRFPAGRVYLAWARFEGGGARIMFSRSLDCGRTWQAQALSDTTLTNQGASIAIAPHDGTVYVVWRQFGRDATPSSIQLAVSRDGGATFTRRTVAPAIHPFDQPKLENRRFRTNTLPTVAADHLGWVYVAWAERSYALASGRTDPVKGDARIVLAVGSNFGATFAARYPIDDTALDADGGERKGHQVMPALTFTAGKLQAIYYDFSDDIGGAFNEFVDEAETLPVDPSNPNVRRRHTVDVRAAHADPGARPTFIPVLVTPTGTSPRLSQYRTIVDPDGTIRQVQFNPPNLPLFVAGTTPFIGDYIDVAGLNFVPYQGGWRHNNGTTSGPRYDGVFPALPVFHATWTDHRDVRPPIDGDWTFYKAPGDPFWKLPGSECVPSHAGMRNANIYTARISAGLYAGSPGNTKPLGFQKDPATGNVVVDPTTGRRVHMQRSFVVFVQNALRVPKTYLLRIINQPGSAAGDRASFVRTPQPPYSDADLATKPFIWLVARVAPLSTISRTVFVTAANEKALVRVDVLEVNPPSPTAPTIGSDARLAPPPRAGGLRTTVLLNPDPTTPAILDPDNAVSDVPVLAEEIHDPEIFDPVVTAIPNVTRTTIEIRNPDESNPDESNPDESNVDEEMPDESNPDESNPDESNPDESNPDESNPDESNLGLLNTALSDDQLATASVVDIQWKIRSRANTTTAFRFQPTFSGERAGKSFQLLITKRYYTPDVDGLTCELGVRRNNQVLVNISGFNPRNPDESNPDESNPDESNPDESNPDESNPDESNPDESNATFFLAPGETATATLRIYDTTTETPPPPAQLAAFEDTAAAVVESFAVNTGEAAPPRDVAGADLQGINAQASPGNAPPGASAQVTWLLVNRGTEATEAASFRTRVLFSTDRTISEDDRQLAEVTFIGTVPPDDPATPAVNEGEIPQSTTVTVPSDVTEGPRFILLLTDALNEVPEADESNNADAMQLGGANALVFTVQPTTITRGFGFPAALQVAIVDAAGQPASPEAVPFVRLGIASGPAGATLVGTLTVANVGGVATFPGITLPTPGTYTLLATGVGFEGPAFALPAVSAAFRVEPDDAPMAVADSYNVASGGVLTISSESPNRLTGNDVDELLAGGPGVPPAGRVLAISLLQSVQHGTLDLGSGGGFVYSAPEGFNGVDFFTYQLNDGVASGNVATARIVVGTGGNAAPVTRPLSITVAEDSAERTINVAANSLDADGDALTVTQASATHGTAVAAGGNILYTPAANYSGPDAIGYVISDGRGGTADGVVDVTVTPVNDNPVANNDGPFTVPLNAPPTTFQVLSNDNDGPDEGETLTIVAVGAASSGTVTFTATTVTYTPNRGNTPRSDSFSYEIADGNGGRAAALVRVNVGQVNQAPTAVDDHAEAMEDGDVSVSVLTNDSDPDEDTLTISAFGGAEFGTVQHNTTQPGVLRYIPTPNFNGTDSFTYTISDGQDHEATATVHVTVAAVNDDPRWTAALPHQVVDEGAANTIIDLTQYATDVDIATNNDALIFEVAHNTNPAVVNASIVGSTLTLDYLQPGTADVGIRATDTHEASAVDAFLVTVRTTNHPPTANADSATTPTGTPVTINVLANDTDPDREVGGARVIASIPMNPPGQVGNNPTIVTLAAGPGTPYVYAGGTQGVSIISTATNAVVELIESPQFVMGANRSAVDPASGLVYFSTTFNTVFAIDARPSSATFNDVLFGTTIGGSRINGLVLDSARGRLYVLSDTSSQMGSTTTGAQARVVVIDANPSSETFGQAIRTVTLGSPIAACAAVNPANGNVFIGTSGANSGVYVMDDETFAVTAVTGVLPVLEMALDTAAGRIYGLSSGGQVLAVDLATQTLVANSVFAVPGLATPNAVQALRHIVVDPGTSRVYIRSNGAQSADGFIFVLQPGGAPAFWTVVAQLDWGRDTGNDDLVIDPVADRVISGAGFDLAVGFIDTNTNRLDGIAQMAQPVGDLELFALNGVRRVYTDGVTNVVPISITPFVQEAPVHVGAETGAVVVNPVTHQAFVPTTAGNSKINILDANGFVGEVTGVLSAGIGRYGQVATRPAANQVYVVNFDANSDGTDTTPGFVSVINAAGHVQATFPVGNGPFFGMAVNQTTGKIHVPANGAAGRPGGVTVVDPAAGTTAPVNVSSLFTTNIGRHIAIVESLGKVYIQPAVVDPGGSPLATYTEGGLVATRVAAAIGLTNVHIFAVNQTTRRLYIGYQPVGQSSRILVLDTTDDSVVTTLNLGSPSTALVGQTYIAFDEPRSRMYIGDFANDALHILDANTHELLRTLHVGDGPTSVAINRVTNRIYVGSTLDSLLTFIDGETMTVRGALALPLAPALLDVDPAQNRIYGAAVRSSLPSGTGMLVIADDSTFFTQPLTVVTVTSPEQGTAVVNADNTVTYTPFPGAAGGDAFSYAISDGENVSAPAAVTIAITPPMTISPATLPRGVTGAAYDVTLATANGQGVVSWSVSSGVLPGGIILTASGRLIGTFTASGTFTFTVRAQDESNPVRVASRTFTVQVGPPIVANVALPNALVGQAYSAMLAAGGTTGAVTWTFVSGTFPEGLTFHPSGLIDGAPSTTGFYSFTVRVEDETGQSATGTVTIFVDGAPRLTSPARAAVLHESYNVPPYVATRTPAILELIGGTLPSPFTISATGNISGTPQTTGRTEVVLRVTDARGRSDERPVTFDTTAIDQTIGSGGLSPSVQALGPTRRLAQTFTAGADGLLTAVRSFQTFCANAGSMFSVELKRVTGADVSVPDDGPPLATAMGLVGSVPATFNQQVFFRAGERFALVFSAPAGCEFRQVTATPTFYHFGHLLESVDGGPWSRLSSAADLSVQTLVAPPMLRYFTTTQSAGSTATYLPSRSETLIAGTNRIAHIVTNAGVARRTATDMLALRINHTATLLDNGHVLIVGGRDGGNPNVYQAQAELLVGDGFQATGSLAQGRDEHTATKLPDGRVVVAGGGNAVLTLSTVEIFDQVTNTFSAAAPLLGPRRLHTATLLTCPVGNPTCAWGGKILFAGGVTFSPAPSAEIYDPIAGTSRATLGSMAVTRGFELASTLLADGRVLFVGGSANAIGAEVFDPATETFTPIADSAAFALERHTITGLPNGDALLVGGRGQDQFERDLRLGVYRFNPTTNRFVGAGTLNAYRSDHTTTLLPDARLLVAGGMNFISNVVGRSFEFFSTAGAANVGITTAALPPGQLNVPYPTTTIEAAGGTSPYSFEIISGQIAPGLNFNNGIISGTPVSNSTYFFVVQVTDSSPTPLTATMPFQIRINGIEITTTALPPATPGVPYSTTLTATGQAPWTWFLTSTPPAGLAFSSAGVLSGTPGDVTGNFTLRFRVEDAAGQVTFKSLTLSIQASLTITTTTMRDAIGGENYGVGLSAAGGSGTRTWTLESGVLPNGITLTTGGTLSGSPWEMGDFVFTARVTDAFGRTATRSLTVHVAAMGYQRFRENQNITTSVAAGPVAQVITSGVAGTIYGVRVDIACSPGQQFVVSLQSVDEATGLPTGTALTSDGPGGVPLIATSAPVGSNVVIPLPGRRYFAIGARFAVVLTATEESGCTVQLNDETGGADALTLRNGTWEPLDNPKLTVAVGTVVDPDTSFVFGSWFSGDSEATHLTCPDTGCGYAEQILLSANTRALQLYDPAAHRMTVVPNAFDRFFSNHTATRLQDGRVLIAGGWQRLPNEPTSSVSGASFIFNPEDRSITPTGAMANARNDHRAVLLRDGRVLVVGGLGPQPAPGSPLPAVQEAEIYDPASGVWSSAGLMIDSRWGHSATLLECPAAQPACPWGGKVLIFGGWTDTWPMVPGEVFDPTALGNKFTAVPGPTDGTRSYHAAVLLADGRVFLSGGWAVGAAGILASTSLYDPAGNSLLPGPDLARPRTVHTATLLNDGTVIVAGGEVRDDFLPTASLERYTPATNTMTGAGSLGTMRREPRAVRLLNGRVAFAGGYSGWSRTQAQSLEVWDPGNLFFIQTTALPDGFVAAAYSQVLLLSGGTAPYTLQVIAGELPPGVVLFNDAGVWKIDGVPTTPGIFAFTVQATDSAGRRTGQALRIEIRNSLVALNPTPPVAMQGTAYDVQLFAAGGAGTEWTWAFEPGFGAMPEGLTLTAQGRLVGTPIGAAGSFSFVVRITDNGSPQQTILQRVRMSVATVDQRQETINAEFQIPMTAASGNTYAQVMTAGRSGRLTGVRLFTSCTVGGLAVFVRQTTTAAPYVPTPGVLAVGVLADVSAPLQWREVSFTAPPFMRAGDPFAISVQSTGDCVFGAAPNMYPAGSVYRAQVTNTNSWIPEARDLAFTSHVEPLEPSSFGTPTVDGRHSAGEWHAAARMNVTLNTPSGEQVPATLLLQNDSANMYMSLVYERQNFDQSNQLAFFFDGDDDRDPFEAGEDLITFSTSPTGFEWFDDNYQSHQDCAPNTCWERDELVDPALEHGMSRDSYLGRTVIVEATHPINSGDVLDLAATLGQTIGLRVHGWIDDGALEAFTQIPASPPLGWMLAAPAGTCVPAPAGLVSWWSADATNPGDDVHGSNHGTFLDTFGTTPSGRFGRAFSNDGGGGLGVADHPSLSPQAAAGEITVEAWINLPALPVSDGVGAAGAMIVAKAHSDLGFEYGLSVRTDGSVQFWLWQLGPTPHAMPRSAAGLVRPGQWHHVVGTYRKGRSARVYLDGVLVAEDTSLAGTTADTPAPLFIGGEGDRGSNLTGSIDEVAIYRLELTPEQVASLYANGKCRPPAQKFTLRVVTRGHGIVTAGTDIHCGGDCLQSYPGGPGQTPVTVTLTAVSHSFGGVSFTGYTGDCVGLTCTLTIDSDKTVIAQFTTNFQPWANWQDVDVPGGRPRTITLTGGDPEGQPITFSIVTPPMHGTLSAVTGNQVTYTPDPGFAGEDSFEFRTHDGFFFSGNATVTLTVEAGPRVGAWLLDISNGAGGVRRSTNPSLVANPDGSYVVARDVEFPVGGGAADTVVTKVSADAVPLWTVRLTGTFGGATVPRLIRLASGAYVYAAGAALPQPGADLPEFAVVVVKLSDTGVVEWQRALKVSNPNQLVPTAIAADAVGDLYVVGNNFNFETGGPPVAWMAKLNSVGELVWQQSLPSASAEGIAIVNGSPVITGTAFGALFVLRLTSGGAKIAYTTFTIPGPGAAGKAITATGDGGYAVAGTSNNRPLILKFGFTHVLQWTRLFSAGTWRIGAIVERSDGRLIVSGMTNAFQLTPSRGWVGGFESANGEVVFQREYASINNNSVAQVALTSDDGLLIAGYNSNAQENIVIIKADGAGVSGCGIGTVDATASFITGTNIVNRADVPAAFASVLVDPDLVQNPAVAIVTATCIP